MGAHIWQIEINKQIIIQSDQQNINGIFGKKKSKKKLEIFENFKLGWYFGLTNQVNHHAY